MLHTTSPALLSLCSSCLEPLPCAAGTSPHQHLKLHTFLQAQCGLPFTDSAVPMSQTFPWDSLLSTRKHGSSDNCVLTWSRLRYLHSRFLGGRMLSHGRHTTVGDCPAFVLSLDQPEPSPAAVESPLSTVSPVHGACLSVSWRQGHMETFHGDKDTNACSLQIKHQWQTRATSPKSPG